MDDLDTLDELDAAIRRAAPRRLGDDPESAERARFLAQAVAAESRTRRAPFSLRKTLIGAAISVGLLGCGITAATAGPAVLAWVGWDAEAATQRTFAIDADDATCQVVARVVPEYRNVSDAEADRRTAEARGFLQSSDWDAAVASITPAEIDAAFELEQSRRAAAASSGDAVPPPATKANAAGTVMVDRIRTAFERAGFLRQGTSLELAVECTPAADGDSE